MKHFWKFKKNEKGMTIMETVVLLALVGAIFVMLAPSIRQWFVGTNPDNGIATQAIEGQIAGFDESKKGAVGVGGVKLLPGCHTDLTNTSGVRHVTNEECSELNN